MTRRRHHARFSAPLTLSAIMLGVGAWGSGVAASTDTTTPTSDDASTEEVGVTEEVGPADDSLEPVVVGFHNLEGGQISLPGIRAGFEQGVQYVNERLGGINGHPLEFVTCNVDVTPESSVDCANQFVEEGVVAAVQGVDVAADAALPVLSEASIAEIAFFSFSPAVNEAQGEAFVTLFSIEEAYAAHLIAQQELGATNVAVLIVDLPSGHAAYEEAIAPVAEELGMTVTPFYYTQATVDWASFAATVMATNPDGIDMGAPTEADCTGAVPAFHDAGFEGVFHAGSCIEFRTALDPSIVEGVVNHAEFYTAAMDDLPAKPAADIAVYREYMEANEPDFTDTVYGPLGFSVAVDAADMLRQVPDDDLSASGVRDALATASGVKFFSESPYDCSDPLWPGTSACGREVLYVRNLGDGALEVLDFSPIDVSAVVPE